MKRKARSRFRGFFAAVLSVILIAASSSTAFALPPQPMVGGLMASIMTGPTKILSDVIDRTVMKGLSIASSATEGSDMQKMFDCVRKILGGGTTIALGNIQKSCEQIQEQIKQLDVTVRAASAHTDQMIAELAVQVTQGNFSDARSKMRDFQSEYNEVINTFSALASALQTYCKDAEDSSVSENVLQGDLVALQAAYDNVEEFYQAVLPAESTAEGVNFVRDLNQYLTLISPYDPSTAITDSATLSDPATWGSRNVSEQTYLDYAHEFYGTQIVGENQMFDLMSASMGEAAAPLITYITAYNMYAAYKAYKISSDQSYLEKETNRQADLLDIWNGFYTAQNKAVRGIYQAESLYEDRMLTWMRSYDTIQMMKMDYEKEEEHLVHEGEVWGKINETLEAEDTRENWMFTLVKPYEKASVYAVSMWNSSSGGFNQNIYDKDMSDSYVYFLVDQHSQSQDYYNLQKTDDEGPDPGYQMPGSAEDLSDLISRNAWDLSENYLDSYLSVYAGVEDLPTVEHGTPVSNSATIGYSSYTPLNESRMNINAWNDDKDTHLTFVNITAPLSADELTANEADLDTNDLYETENPRPLIHIMKNTDTISRTVSLETDGIHTLVYNGDSKLLENSGSTSLASGTTLTLKVYPDEGRTIDKIELMGKDGGRLHTIYESTMTETAENGEKITMDVESTLYETGDGGYLFKLSAPYQNCKIKVTSKQASPKTYNVSLNSAVNGDLQFESHLGLTAMSFTEGDTVTVYARPFSGYSVDTITVLDAADGKTDLNLAVAPSDATPYAPGEKVFTFQMPGQDVLVDAAFEEGTTIRFDTDRFVKNESGEEICYLSFDEPCYYDDWEDTSRTVAAGETLTFASVCDKDYYLKSIRATVAASGEENPVSVKVGGHFSVTAGEEDILISPEYGKRDGQFLANIVDTYPQQGRLVFFADEKGASLQDVGKLYHAGDTVRMNVTDQRLKDATFIVTDTQGNNITASVGLKMDSKNSVLSMTMPEQDVMLLVPEVHNYVNGICRDEGCGHYQTPGQNEEGVYQIKNAGNLFWLAALVNNDPTHATFIEQNRAPKAELVSDIDLESLQWTAIGNERNEFTGSLDGGHHTISNFYMKLMGDHEKSVEGGLFGWTQNALIQNFSLKGKAELEFPAGASEDDDGLFFASVAAFAEYTTISHVYSYVDIDTPSAEPGYSAMYAGGIADSLFDSTIEGCVNFGTIQGSLAGSSGIAVELMNSSVKNSANIGRIDQTGTDEVSSVGGISGDAWASVVLDPSARVTVENSYNYGKLSAPEQVVIHTILHSQTGVSANNCYYLDTSSEDGENATPKTAEQFKSGEAGWLLNNGVTDGTQAWYQNIDNGKTPDDYPLPDDTRGTIYYIESENRYSNYPGGYEPAEPQEFAIRTYEDLVEFARLVDEEYDDWKNADVWLENNIVAPADSVWETGIGSVSENKPFIGSFDGKGYCISGLNVKGGSTSGLFEWVGHDGSVSNLFLIDCDYANAADIAGGIAAVNDGTISYCMNGLNLTTGVYVNPKDGSLIPLAEFNSVIQGGTAGGIAAKNSGSIYACRAAAEIHVSTSQAAAGSIAGENTGTISNCAGNSTVTVTDQQESYAGGICGSNSGSIEGGYSSSAIPKTESAVSGSLSGNAENGHFTDAYYTISEDQTPYGTGTPAEENNINGLRRGSMMEDSFLDLLKATASNSVEWVRNNALNAGLPRIVIPGVSYAPTTLRSRGVTISGKFHEGVQAEVTGLTQKSEAWEMLARSAGDAVPKSAYAFHLEDQAGNFIPEELWTQSDVTFTVPVKTEDVRIAVLLQDGSTRILDPGEVTVTKKAQLLQCQYTQKRYEASFEASGIAAFMVLEDTTGGTPDPTVIPTPTVTPTPEPGDTPEAFTEKTFKDVKPGNWFYDSVKYVFEHKIMTGMTTSCFGAAEDLSRAQFAAILYRIAGEPQVAAKQIFPDVPITEKTKWYADAVAWAKENKIILGYKDGTFGPADEITREQLAVMLYRYAQAMGYDTGNKADFSKYPDAKDVSPWAKDAMQWAVGNGIISGQGGVYLDAQGHAARAECAAMIERFMTRFVEA